MAFTVKAPSQPDKPDDKTGSAESPKLCCTEAAGKGSVGAPSISSISSFNSAAFPVIFLWNCSCQIFNLVTIDSLSEVTGHKINDPEDWVICHIKGFLYFVNSLEIPPAVVMGGRVVIIKSVKMNLLNRKKSNILSVTYQLLSEIKVNVNLGTLSKNLESHPEYPGLLTICDCLKKFKVDNHVYRIEKENYNDLDLPFPFISHSSKDGGSFFLVHGMVNGELSISDEKKKYASFKKEDFFAEWEGLVLYAKANEESGEPDYLQHYIQSLLHKIAVPAFLAVVLSVLVLIFRLYPFSLAILALCLIKFTGTAISMMLIAQRFSASHSWIRKACITAGKNDCNAILQSRAAQITPWFSWAEAGLFYFSGSFFVALIFPQLVPIVFWINVFALPYTVYSVVYQYRIKKWCILCCGIQALLLLEYVAFNFIPGRFDAELISRQVNLIFPFLLCFLVPVVSWGIIKPVLQENSVLAIASWQLKQFKYNSELFMLGLMKQQHYEAADELKPIVLGAPTAEIVITLVSNPFCGPCSEVHHFFDQWLRERADLQLRIILLASGDASHIRAAQHMIALGLLKDKKLIAQALNEWYGQSPKIYEKWKKKYPVLVTENIKSVFRKQQQWCEQAGINFTPAILVNGHILPEPYVVEDLKYLIS